ncbi:MAG: ribulose-phosphate 3-epimerase [Candidatus Hydrogenedentes bacterium]|nr:ribulose-phosphate 3-epimerase [Candidatus Hydrogenedentota bacterium]
MIEGIPTSTHAPESSAVKYSASVMCANLGRLEEELEGLESAGCHELHFDVMDGHFVPNMTLGFDFIRTARRCCSLPCAAHLMIAKPEQYIDAFAKAGCVMITVHTEMCVHAPRTLSQIRELGLSPGIAINPCTPLSRIDYLLEYVDRVLVMTVDPGYAGQDIITNMFQKVERLKQIVVPRCPNVAIEVDGNINLPNAKRLVASGATILVLGTSSIFDGQHSPGESLTQFHRKLFLD